MMHVKRLQLIYLLFGFSMYVAKPLEDSEAKRASQPPIGETIRQVTDQLGGSDSTLQNITLDTRTPPRVKQQMKNHHKFQPVIENSHPGLAIPADEDEIFLEETTKGTSSQKTETKGTTTDKSLSTWVLLNSQTVSPVTPKPTVKPIIKLTTRLDDANGSFLVTNNLYKPIKPFFKNRPTTSTTTKKPSTTTKMVMPVTKVKFSVLQNSKNKTHTTSGPSKKVGSTTTASSVSFATKTSTNVINDKPTSNITSSTLPPEPKDQEVDLSKTTVSSKKTTRKPSKKKKNKNRRRRPAGDKNNTTSTEVNKISEKPLRTQIYNYLSREIIPTVGMGLVGLVVTAGLASYFLYPFGTISRSYEVDRKDVKGNYYYEDEYSTGGVAEEEMIGKVLAGMPDNQGLEVSSEKDNYYNSRNRKVDNMYDKVNLRPQNSRYNSYRESIDAYVPQNNYNQYDVNKEQTQVSEPPNKGYSTKQFVVGAITKKMMEVTPAVVPEHGPRKLERRKRDSNDLDNEISHYEVNEILSDAYNPDSTTSYENSTPSTTNHPDVDLSDTGKVASTSTTFSTDFKNPCTSSSTKEPEQSKPSAFGTTLMQAIRDLIELKISLGLETMKNATMTVSRYLNEVQRKFDSRRRRH